MPGLNLVRIYMPYCNTFDLISQSPATKVCLLSRNNSVEQSQKAVLFTLQVSRYCLLDFQGRIVIRIPLIALIFSMTQCASHLNVYYSGGQMLAALAHNFTIIRTTASFEAIACYAR